MEEGAGEGEAVLEGDVLTVVRFGRLLSLVLWVGGIVFFAFVLAPVAFGRLPSAREAGLVVGGTLRVLHGMGLVCGGVFVALTCAGVRRRGAPVRRLAAECGLVLGMMAVTAYSQFSVLPEMERDRAEAGGDVNAASTADPSRRQFERLHKLSEQMEGAVLLGGLGVLLGLSGERTGLNLES